MAKRVTKKEFYFLIQNSALTKSAERIFHVLLYFQQYQGYRTAPTIGTLVRTTKLSERTVHYWMQALEVAGYIIHVGWSRKYGSKSYRIVWEKLCDDIEFPGERVQLLHPKTKKKLQGGMATSDPSSGSPLEGSVGGCATASPFCALSLKHLERGNEVSGLPSAAEAPLSNVRAISCQR
jgi:hypothetical protein